MTRNLVLLFAATFTALTALDLVTTWVGVLHMGYAETNPYTDLSSVEGLVIPEIITLFIGMALVALGAELRKTTLHDTSRGGFKTFMKTAFVRKHFPTFLILAPMVFAVLRAVVVLSNTSIILTGYGLFIDEEFSHLSWNQFVLTVCAVIVVWPTGYLIYRVCRASTP
ncbi:MAG: hypothetical protein OXP28_04475 [Gammaproteobacteria bacterium]|nr:hypothetical protein [Gammaproteobacteria bacterium]MDE0224374.1 hypothetical protein [Gammaproteobacteria bacterium]